MSRDVEYDRKVQWLRRYQTAIREVDILTGEVDQMRAMAERVTPRLSGVPGGSSSSDSLPRAVERIVEAQHKLECEINHMLETKSEISTLIGSVKNDRPREILRRRYISGEKWEAIACAMDMDYRWLLRIHHKIVANLDI